MLDPAETGRAGGEFVRWGPNHAFVLLAGSLVAFALGGVVFFVLGGDRISRVTGRLSWLLRRPRSVPFALVMAGLAFVVTTVFSLVALKGNPALLDSASQLLQARYFAEGMLAGPALPSIEFWDFQYMMETEAGWVSQYPPGHILLLALGFRLGLVWLVGPLLLAGAVFLTSLIGEELFPGRKATSRLGALMLALSPFAIALAGSYMNHVTAMLGASLALYAALRCLKGHWAWALVTGAAIGLMVVTRPLFGIVMGVVATITPWLLSEGRVMGRGLASRVSAVLAGGFPWAVFLFWYNERFFGSPFRFGYSAVQGSAHGLGFHRDPWGARYGLVEALGYSAGEVRALSIELLQTPLPPLLLIAAYALWVARIPRAAWILVVWVCAPLLANAFYWHHDLVMGPRMLNETAPAWVLLSAFAGVGLVDRMRQTDQRPTGRSSPLRPVALSGLSAWMTASFGVALLVGWGLLGPTRLLGYGLDARDAGWADSSPGTIEPALVFVHGSWQGRLGARLVAAGLPSDSVRIALDSNPTCEVQTALDLELARERLNFVRGALSLVPTSTATGGVILVGQRGTGLDGVCEREIASDGWGVLGLPQMLWQGDLPGLIPRGALFVRDMGPERNLVILAAFPSRKAAVLRLTSTGADLALVSYDEGMRRYWEIDD